ncbi:MAG: hypothetical protein KC680_03495 [Candidatus Peregrinibacteria bacterium]|nr:hypothetical protein [Candidatus Peregrinibacteria bacterium]MCB9808409.1 hypothetical protein [Candidatus Peribacteria bacterium]
MTEIDLSQYVAAEDSSIDLSLSLHSLEGNILLVRGVFTSIHQVRGKIVVLVTPKQQAEGQYISLNGTGGFEIPIPVPHTTASRPALIRVRKPKQNEKARFSLADESNLP